MLFRSKDLMKRLSAAKEVDTNVISIDQAKKNLYERTEAVTRGWSKIPEIQKRKALRRLIKEVLIGPEGMDIYYYYNSLAEEKSLGVFSISNENLAKVIPFGPRGNESYDSGSDSKLSVLNCPMSGMVMPLRFERRTYALEGKIMQCIKII